MEINDYQRMALETDNNVAKSQDDKPCKGSHFYYEYFDFSSENDKLPIFVEMLKSRGCYISDDGHIRSRKGGLMSKLVPNGYWLTCASYKRKILYFCEHRVIWVWYNGAIPEGFEINHIDYNRGNNHIENLELVTHSQNMLHSKPNFNPCYGEKSPKSKLTDSQAKMIKTLCNSCGWSKKDVSELIDGIVLPNNVSRIANGKRFPHIKEAGSLLEIYPTIVDFTRNKSISIEEELKNYCLGLAGEAGEVVDLVKKMLYHGKKDISPTDIMYELGDILYYLVAIANVLGIDFQEIAYNNNAKLLARYPNGFSEKDSNNRIEERAEMLKDKSERLCKLLIGDNR